MANYIHIEQVGDSDNMSVNITGQDEVLIEMLAAAIKNDERFSAIIIQAIVSASISDDEDLGEKRFDIHLN